MRIRLDHVVIHVPGPGMDPRPVAVYLRAPDGSPLEPISYRR